MAALPTAGLRTRYPDTTPGLFRRLLSPWTTSVKARQTVDVTTAVGVGLQQQPVWPEDDYETYARQGYGRNEIAFACVTQIATSAAEARFRSMVGRGDARREDETSDLAAILRRPNPRQSQFAFVELWHTYLQVAGNAYVFKLRGGAGQVMALYLLRPDRVRVWPGPDGVRGYVYTLDGQPYFVAPEDIGHTRLPNPFDDLYGLSPFHVLARRVSLDSSMAGYQKAFFDNSGVPSGFLKVKRKIQTQEEADEIRGRWRAQFRGPLGWHRLGLLDEDADYQQLALDLDKMAMPDLTQIAESRICAAFGVPLSLVQATLGQASYAEAARVADVRTFWSQTLMPLYRRMADELTMWLASEFGGRAEVEADFDGVRALAEDEDKRVVRATTAFREGVATRDEARAMMGLDPVPGAAGQMFRAPANVQEFDAVGIPEPEPAPARPPPGTPAPDQGQSSPADAAQQARTFGPVITKAVDVDPRLRLVAALADAAAPWADRGRGDLERYFRRLVSRVDGIIGRYLERLRHEPDTFAPLTTKGELPFNESTFFPPEVDAELARLIRDLYLAVASATWAAIDDSALVGTAVFQPEAPVIQDLLREAAGRVTGINDVTRMAVRELLAEGTRRGYSVHQIAAGVPADDFRGLRSVVTETYANRAEIIARTEVGHAQNRAAAARYDAVGVMRVDILDGDADEVCAAVNGTRQTLDWLRAHPLGHPNCTRVPLPVVEGLEGVLGGAA